jgi:hypothetical protein
MNKKTIINAAFESSVDYKPFEENLTPQNYYEIGFIKGAEYINKIKKELFKEAFNEGYLHCQYVIGDREDANIYFEQWYRINIEV